MSELEQTIEELEAEVLAELEEASAASDPQKKGAAPAEKADKVEGEVQDGGKPVDEPETASSPTDVAAKSAKPVSGDAQQKGAKPAEGPKKLQASAHEELEVSEDHESDEEVIEEAAVPRTKMEMLKAMYSEMENMKAKDLKANFGKIMSAMHPEAAHEDVDEENVDEEGRRDEAQN